MFTLVSNRVVLKSRKFFCKFGDFSKCERQRKFHLISENKKNFFFEIKMALNNWHAMIQFNCVRFARSSLEKLWCNLWYFQILWMFVYVEEWRYLTPMWIGNRTESDVIQSFPAEYFHLHFFFFSQTKF